MKVKVDPTMCMGHARCVSLAPALFESDELGNAVVIGDGSVSSKWEEAVKLAVTNCPEYAISMIE